MEIFPLFGMKDFSSFPTKCFGGSNLWWFNSTREEEANEKLTRGGNMNLQSCKYLFEYQNGIKWWRRMAGNRKQAFPLEGIKTFHRNNSIPFNQSNVSSQFLLFGSCSHIHKSRALPQQQKYSPQILSWVNKQVGTEIIPAFPTGIMCPDNTLQFHPGRHLCQGKNEFIPPGGAPDGKGRVGAKTWHF